MKKNLFALLFCLALCQGSLLAQNEPKTQLKMWKQESTK